VSDEATSKSMGGNESKASGMIALEYARVGVQSE
jgi:hypothetical protein